MKEKQSTVEKMLKMLHKTISKKMYIEGFVGCNDCSKEGFICCLNKGHTGSHIAIGSEKIVHLWS
jgi:hypothetical protein